MKDHIQSGILLDVPAHSRYLTFSILPGGDLPAALKTLATFADGKHVVVGIGKATADAFNASISGVPCPGLLPRMRDWSLLLSAEVLTPSRPSLLV